MAELSASERTWHFNALAFTVYPAGAALLSHRPRIDAFLQVPPLQPSPGDADSAPRAGVGVLQFREQMYRTLLRTHVNFLDQKDTHANEV